MTILILGNINHEYNDTSSTYDLLQIPWVPDVAADPEIVFGIDVELLLHSATYGIDVSIDLEGIHTLRPFIYNDVEALHSLHVERLLFSSTYGVTVSVDTESSYLIGTIMRDIESFYSIRGTVYDSLECVYDINLYYDYGDIQAVQGIQVSTDLRSDYSMLAKLTSDIYSEYQMIAAVELDLESSFDIITVNHVYKNLRVVYMLYSPASETIITDALITVNDEF